MCGRHPLVKMDSVVKRVLFAGGVQVMCTTFECSLRELLAMMLFATTVPIIPTASRANDEGGLSEVSFP
jgi:hypothetical protein